MQVLNSLDLCSIYPFSLFFTEREQLIRYKFKWTDADTDPMDNKLTKEEFLAFRHPEQSEQALAHMVKTIIDSLGTCTQLPLFFTVMNSWESILILV